MNAYSQPMVVDRAPRRGLRRLAEGLAIGILAVLLFVYPSGATGIEPGSTAKGRPALEQLAEKEVLRERDGALLR